MRGFGPNSQIAASSSSTAGRLLNHLHEAGVPPWFQQHAQVMQLFKQVENERKHTPAAAERHLGKTFMGQAKRRPFGRVSLKDPSKRGLRKTLLLDLQQFLQAA